MIKATCILKPCFLLLFLLITTQACAITPEWDKGKMGHHVNNGFRNYPVIQGSSSLSFSFIWSRIISSFNQPVVPETHVLAEDKAVILYSKLRDKNTLTWIGQSTVLLKIEGKVILTDPFFSKVASPLPIGPERYVKPGISTQNLPSIDIILISHNHFDHLDENFIEGFSNKESVHIFVPLKLKPFFVERGYKKVHELDWYESFSLFGFELTFLPTVHYSSRSTSDRNKTLWGSWAISSSYGKYFFIGDSAYSPSLFKEIGQKIGPFDLAMLTIGTYGNKKYGFNNHTTPEEAVLIGKEIGAKALLGIHWGTIDLSEEDPWEPPLRFNTSAKDAGYSPTNTWLLKIGETREL
jgi:N-acyl-phosphatidylethanolamine-hydrolysing phospholipase D